MSAVRVSMRGAPVLQPIHEMLEERRRFNDRLDKHFRDAMRFKRIVLIDEAPLYEAAVSKVSQS